jgi:hypothetical protein
MVMRDEKQVRELYESMKEYAGFVTDGLQREGYLNFMSALSWVLMDNGITDAQVERAAKELGLRVSYVQVG